MKNAKKIIALLLSVLLAAAFASCKGSTTDDNTDSAAPGNVSKTYKVGICNYVDDASLNQINENIQSELKRQIEEKNSPYVIVAIPLLFEHHLEHLVDRILVVDVKEDLQLKRLCRRDSINETLAKSIIASQVTREERLKKADDLIESDESPLDKKLNVVVKLHNMYLNFAK